jgi:hypothetical protein
MQITNKEIATRLTDRANVSNDNGDKIVVLRLDGFAIKCRDDREHILAVAEKYLKARPLTTKQTKDWGVWGSKLNSKLISTRYANDQDKHEFYALLGE